jgi:hypothetical protein
MQGQEGWRGPPRPRFVWFPGALLAFACLFIGILWLLLLNGQFFSNALGCIACCILGISLAAVELAFWGRLSLPRRFVGCVAVALCLGLAGWLTVHLPEAYEQQGRFNRGEWGRPPPNQEK